MRKKERAKKAGEILDRIYPQPDIPLQHRDPFTLLVAVVLSAQTTDVMVNRVTPALFAKAKTPTQMAALPLRKILSLIRTCGLSQGKARNIKRLSEIVVKEHSGKVPRDMEALERLPGVLGQKAGQADRLHRASRGSLETGVHRLVGGQARHCWFHDQPGRGTGGDRCRGSR